MSGISASSWRIHRIGGPEVLEWEQAALPPLAPNEARVRHTAIGFNFTDVYHRDGRYPIPLPSGLGNEAAGVVEAVGSAVEGLEPGMRVGYLTGPVRGAYADRRNIDAKLLLPLPDGVSDVDAAALLIKGVTVQYLMADVHPVRKGDTILFHAAAGGVGSLAGQWAKALGATVIGTVSTPEKAQQALRCGYDHVIVTGRENFVERVREITQGRGVPVVFDSVGKDTYTGSLDCLAMRGHLVSFGSASGIPAPVDIRQLSGKGSLSLTRATLVSFTTTREETMARTNEVFARLAAGDIRAQVGKVYPLSDAPQVHADAEARRTTGSLVMEPAHG